MNKLGKRVDIKSIFRHLKLLKYLWYNVYHGVLKLLNRSLAIAERLPPSGLLTNENTLLFTLSVPGKPAKHV